MTDFSTESTANTDNAAFAERIQQLEAALAEMTKQKDEAYMCAYHTIKENDGLKAQIKEVQARIQQLEDPDGRNNGTLGWLGKIVLVLRRVNRPMRKKEIEKELQDMEKRPVRRYQYHPDSHVSVVLHKGVKAGRLKYYKVPGTRGGYYALEEWADKDGHLAPEMKQQIF